MIEELLRLEKLGSPYSCAETLGLGCLLGAFGGYVAKTSNDQAHDGSRAAFGKYTSNEGQRILDSFNLQTYPGENDPIKNAAWDGLKLGAGVVLYKFGPKAIASIEERLTLGTGTTSVKVTFDELPAPRKTTTPATSSQAPSKVLQTASPSKPVANTSSQSDRIANERIPDDVKVKEGENSLEVPHIGGALDEPTVTRWNPSGKRQNCIACVGSYMTDKEGMIFMTADDIERNIASVDPSRGIQMTEALRIIRVAAQAESRPLPYSPFLDGSPAGQYAIFLGPDRNALKHVIHAERFENGTYKMFDPQNGQNIFMDDLWSLRTYWGGSINSPLVPVFVKGVKE